MPLWGGVAPFDGTEAREPFQDHTAAGGGARVGPGLMTPRRILGLPGSSRLEASTHLSQGRSWEPFPSASREGMNSHPALVPVRSA